MELEKRIAYMVDVGIIHYKNCLLIQDTLQELRKQDDIPDLILYGQHYPVISFGGSSSSNGFTSFFLETVKSIYGNTDLPTIVDHLSELGIDFYNSLDHDSLARGGGSAYTGPGQLVVYPIVKHEAITRRSIGYIMYKQIIDTIMIDVFRSFGIDAQIKTVADTLLVDIDARKDRKDVWIQREKPYKLGGKAIRFSGPVALHGFSLYVTKESLRHFDKVLVCGYTQNQLGVTSIEHELGRNVLLSEVRDRVFSFLLTRFGYESIKERSLDDFLPMEVVA